MSAASDDFSFTSGACGCGADRRRDCRAGVDEPLPDAEADRNQSSYGEITRRLTVAMQPRQDRRHRVRLVRIEHVRRVMRRDRRPGVRVEAVAEHNVQRCALSLG